jgi:hypothetical protein
MGIGYKVRVVDGYQAEWLQDQLKQTGFECSRPLPNGEDLVFRAQLGSGDSDHNNQKTLDRVLQQLDNVVLLMDPA